MTKFSSHVQLASLILGVCIMSTLSSCGGSHVASGGGEAANPILQTGPIINGKYIVQLTPLNSSVSGYSLVTGKIKIDNDEILVRLNAKGTPVNTLHLAAIYKSDKCPAMVHDLNSDGFIDPLEIFNVIGEALIPLDGDLNTQAAGSDIYPYADLMGNYKYEQKGIFSSMLLDLTTADLDPKDGVTKLVVGEKLKLEGKVLVIYGVSDDTYLPGSIRGNGQTSDHITLPIACGKITRDYLNDETGE